MIEAGENTLTLDLHPRLTVVGGIGRVEREGLIGELIGALGGSRPGLHLELEERSGRHLAVFRPTSGRPRIVDVDRARDVTAEFTGEDGDCSLLTHLGLDSQGARRVMRFGAADLATSSNRSQAVDVLAALDQRRVWNAADGLRSAEWYLTSEAEAIGSAPEDAAMIEEVEARHNAVEQAADRFESTRKRTFWIGGGCRPGHHPRGHRGGRRRAPPHRDRRRQRRRVAHGTRSGRTRGQGRRASARQKRAPPATWASSSSA